MTGILTQVGKIPDIQLMPAGLFYPNHGGFGIYIKWKGNGMRFETQVLSASSWHLHFKAPDREVLVVGQLHGVGGDISMGDWDEFVPLSLFHEPLLTEHTGPRALMVNAHQFNGKINRSHNTRGTLEPLLGAPTIFGDSGGYQLKRKSEFIDPQSVAEYYNTNVDYGMVLDFPLWDAYNWPNLERAAHIQKENIRIMLEHTRSNVNLVNVAHGIKPKHRRKFLDIVHHEQITSIAIAKSSYSEGITPFIDGVLSFVTDLRERYGNHYKHLHILGLSDNKTFIPIMRMAALGLFGDMKITMDSSTHLQMSISKTFFQSRHSTENYAPLKYGNDGNFPSPLQRCPCNCPVCTAVGWVDAYNLLAGNSVTTFLLMYHNIHAINDYFNQMLWYASNLDHSDLVLMCKNVFSSNKSVVNELEQSLNYIETVKTAGIKVAEKKFAFFLKLSDKGANADIMSGTLFGGMVLVDKNELDEFDFNGVDEAGTPDADKPLSVLDQERMDLFVSRVGSMNIKRDMAADGSSLRRVKRPKKKKSLKRVVTNEDGTTTVVEKTIGSTKKLASLGVKMDDDKKILNTIKANSGPSLTKYKQSQRNKNKPQVKDKDTKVVMGKTITKSKNRKKL